MGSWSGRRTGRPCAPTRSCWPTGCATTRRPCRDRGTVGAVGVPLRVLRRLGSARPASGVPRQRPGRRALGARARGVEQRRRAVHGRRAGPRRRGAGSSGRASPDGADRPACRKRWPPRADRVLARPGRAARSAVREHAAGPAERARRRARLRVDRGRDDRHRRRRADERRRRVRRRRCGDRAFAVGGQRDRHRVARRLRGRARASRAGRSPRPPDLSSPPSPGPASTAGPAR